MHKLHQYSSRAISHMWCQHGRDVQKTASYYVMHMVVAIVVAWAITGSWKIAVSISLVEPLVQSVAYFMHERIWAKRDAESVDTANLSAAEVGRGAQAAC